MAEKHEGFEAQSNITLLAGVTLESLTKAIIAELVNIGATAISTTQWGYLGTLDQPLATANSHIAAYFQTTGGSLADDEATSFEFANSRRFFFIMTNWAEYVNGFVRSDGIAKTTTVFHTGGWTVLDGVNMTGTSGADGDISIGVGPDGKLYIENRKGGTRSWNLTFIGNI